MGMYVNNSLVNNEKVLYTGAFALWDNFFWIVISFGTLLIPIFLFQKFSEIAITNNRVVGKSGILRRKTYDFGLKNIESIDVKQTILGRIFGYGDIVITGSGASNLLIPALKSPEEFKKQLNSVKYTSWLMLIQEEIIWEGTPSQLVNIKCYVLCGIFFWTIIPLFVMYWNYLKIKNTKFIITSQRLISKEGVFNKTTEQIELYRIKDIILIEPFLLRIFNLGNITLITSDKTKLNLLLSAMHNPNNMRDTIRNLVEDLRVSKDVKEVDFRWVYLNTFYFL